MCGASVPQPPAPSVGREPPKPTASFQCLPLSKTDWGMYFVLNLKNLACCCYVSNPLLKSYLGKRVASFLANPTITSRNSSQGTQGLRPATLAGAGPGCLPKRETRTLLTPSASTNFPAGCLASSGILIRKSSHRKEQKPFSKRERKANSSPHLIMNRKNCVKT